jgi:hypothetical protein
MATRNISPTVVEAPSSPDPSKLTQFTSNGTKNSGINTRATSWEDSDVLLRKTVAHVSEIKLHKSKRTENREEVVEEVEREISVHEDRVTETPQRRRNVTITFSSPLESVILPMHPSMPMLKILGMEASSTRNPAVRKAARLKCEVLYETLPAEFLWLAKPFQVVQSLG